MAYTQNSFSLGRGKYNNHISPDGLAIHTYKSLTDTLATIIAADYFTDYFGFDPSNFELNDLLYISDSTGESQQYKITSLDPVTITAASDADNVTQDELNFVTTWGGAFSPAVSGGNIRLIKRSSSGDAYGTVEALFDGVTDTTTAVSIIQSTSALPAEYRPTSDFGPVTQITKVSENNVGKTGEVVIGTDGKITFYSDENNALFATVPFTGWSRFTMTWQTS